VTAVAYAVPPRPDTPVGVEAVWRPRRWIWRFRTRWTDPVTGRRPPAEFDTIAEVEAFRGRLQLARVRGEVAELARGDETVDGFATGEWWPRYARRALERTTLRGYASVYNNHVATQVGHLRLRQLTPPRIADMRDQLLDAGVGDPTVRRALVILQGICTFAVELGAIGGNPCRDVLKPPVTRQLAIVAPSATAIEAVRAQLDPVNAALVSIIGYEGLRPSEALALEDRHRGKGTLLVEQRLIDGRIVRGQKTGRRRDREHRSPTLYAIVGDDLDQVADLRRGRGGLLFPNDHGKPWTPRDYRNWRENVFAPAVERAGVNLGRPYDLRHGCASLLLHANRPLTEIAEHMGHSVATLSRYYRHLIADRRGQDPVDVEHQIAAARLGGRDGRFHR
jgi:integrase